MYMVGLATETGIIFVLFPETKGVSFEEAAIVMDGDKANVEVIHIGETDKVGASVEEKEFRGRPRAGQCRYAFLTNLDYCL